MRIRGAILDSVRRQNYKNATLEPTEAAPEPVAAPVIETAIDDGRLRRKVRDAMSWLPAHEQAVLDEYYSPAEPDLRAVGVVLEISRGTAKRVRREAIAHIRQRLRIDGTAA
jgi:RNA polymerase sigma factor (sigma-70 family)